MRYRSIRYRYAEVSGRIGPEPLGQLWVTRIIPLARPQWRPPVDYSESGAALSVKIDVAGISEEDLEITLYDDTLVVEGVRSWEVPAEQTRFHAVEIRYGPFRLEVPVIAPVDRNNVTARYEKGFLIVHLPKAGERL